jgi:hypothetical protein
LLFEETRMPSLMRLAGMDVSGITAAGTVKDLPAVERLLVVRSDPANTKSFLLVRGKAEASVFPGDVVLAYTNGLPDGLDVVPLIDGSSR